MGREWKDKCERLLASAQEKHQRALQDLQEEKERVEDQLAAMEKKVGAKGALVRAYIPLESEPICVGASRWSRPPIASIGRGFIYVLFSVLPATIHLGLPSMC